MSNSDASGRSLSTVSEAPRSVKSRFFAYAPHQDSPCTLNGYTLPDLARGYLAIRMPYMQLVSNTPLTLEGRRRCRRPSLWMNWDIQHAARNERDIPRIEPSQDQRWQGAQALYRVQGHTTPGPHARNGKDGGIGSLSSPQRQAPYEMSPKPSRRFAIGS